MKFYLNKGWLALGEKSMRKSMGLLLLIVVALLILPLGVMAETTGGADYDNDLGGFNGIRDYVAGHDHEYTDKDTVYDKEFAVGAGLDIIVQERAEKQNNLWPVKTTVEGRYDFNNEEGSVYGVATYRLAEIGKGIKDLFK